MLVNVLVTSRHIWQDTDMVREAMSIKLPPTMQFATMISSFAVAIVMHLD
jgi:hypothetical protein